MGCAFIGCGKALPKLEVKNDDLTALVDTNDEWIFTRTGIKSRHIAVGESNTDLAEQAARAALGWANGGWSERRITPEEIDLLIVATITPDTVVPSAASDLRQRLGLPNAVAFDLNAACTGFLYAITVAESMMAAASSPAASRTPVRRALVVGVERLSHLTDWNDRTTCVLFGDAAGAAVLEWRDDRAGIRGSFLANADDDARALFCPTAYDAPLPFDESGVFAHKGFATASSRNEADVLTASSLRPYQTIAMNGRAVFKFATNVIVHAVTELLSRCRLTLDDIALIVPHQANERIVASAAKKLGYPMERFHMNIAEVGNSSAASIPCALADAYERSIIARGDLVLLVGFGGGYTSGAVLYEA